ncbi:sensor histidine kinase [Galbitalea soli]|uniref:histidine kinase n=1 Tax=Galbitalea soli TaxID=1268042 RepID=A0A7C9PKQ7_9MICO|nr:histidine kinase [Galbitalea soli]NEM89850.1 sensor histidine kinase [Galbitalea soli]NYJ30554.1 signal transduction histidine kinase [Galbitalea soli]
MKTSQLVVDGSIAFVFLLLMTHSSLGEASRWAVAVGFTVSLAIRRFSPPLSLGVAWVTALAQMFVFHNDPSIVDLAILATLYTSSAYGDRALKWAGCASVAVGAIVGSLYLNFGASSTVFEVSSLGGVASAAIPVLFVFIAMAVLLGLPWTAGLLVRARIAARESREAQLLAQRGAELAERDVIVEQERTRIARDMHDVVAHSLAVVIAQADGARYARASDPAAADAALDTISATAREALGEVRVLLGQLRHPQSDGPQPGLDELPRLLDQLRASGLVIEFEARGETRPLGAGPQLAAYRIVQEALTNALRHGDVSGPVAVRLSWSPRELEITVVSALVAAPATGELRLGHGLAGMRERAALVGGRLTTEVNDRHFGVRAILPVTGTAHATTGAVPVAPTGAPTAPDDPPLTARPAPGPVPA